MLLQPLLLRMDLYTLLHMTQFYFNSDTCKNHLPVKLSDKWLFGKRCDSYHILRRNGLGSGQGVTFGGNGANLVMARNQPDQDNPVKKLENAELRPICTALVLFRPGEHYY